MNHHGNGKFMKSNEYKKDYYQDNNKKDEVSIVINYNYNIILLIKNSIKNYKTILYWIII